MLDLEFAELACDLAGPPHHLIREIAPPRRQTLVKRLSTAKVQRLAGDTCVSLEDGMAQTRAWLRTLRVRAA